MEKRIILLLSLIFVFIGFCSCDPDPHPHNEDDDVNEPTTEQTEKNDDNKSDDESTTGKTEGNDDNKSDTPTDSTDNKYVNMYYIVVCGSDLLQYVAPEVTYTEADGTNTTILLTANDWKEDTKEKNEENGETEVVDYRWEKEIHFSNYDVSGKISVKYRPLMDYSEMKGMNARYDRMHNFIDIKATNKENPSIGITSYTGCTILLGENAVANHIKKLCDTTMEKYCYVSDDGTITIK